MDDHIITRTKVSKIEMLQSLIDKKTDQAARIRAKLCDPVSRSISSTNIRDRDPFKREKMITECDDRAAEIEKEIESLQSELSVLQNDVIKYVESRQPKNFETRAIIKMRLVWGCTWEETADLVGYSQNTCRLKYSKWVESL